MSKVDTIRQILSERMLGIVPIESIQHLVC